ncbi:16S rRNA (guanine(966)-N(2))-methyltransferase RsmD [Melioribacteraceae bacterium 4301-Me]|uniref:16S rRNA (guanine(966)-N(2))-methyltransferase RsmD n=1 Tax=Pyranulibacter aquaticus TaxID=3163344 RepID=UPI003595C8FA
MRIVSGIYKGRMLKFPNSKLVRPTTDKVKESLFNYLQNQIDFNNIVVCDLYAGSGSLGLEAMSRGASKCDFVESNFNVSKILKENIENIITDKSYNIFKMDAVRFSKMKNHEEYDLILADPPFFKYEIHLIVPNLLINHFLKPNGRLIIERSIQTEKKDIASFKKEAFKRIGDSLIYQFFCSDVDLFNKSIT